MDGLAYTVSLVDLITAPAKAAAGSIDKLRGGLAQMQPATENGAAAMKDLDGFLEALGPIAAGASEAITVLAGALAAGAAMAIKASEAKAALTTTFDALGKGAITGKQTIAMLDELGETTGMTREQLAPMTKEFMAMGVTSVDALKKMTTAAASAQAIMGDPSAANAFTTLQKKIQEAVDTGTKLKIPAKGLANLAEMGLSVDDVAKKMGISANALATKLKAGTVDAKQFGDALQDALISKGAGPLDRMSKSVDALKAKFTEGISKLFEDVDTGPFLAGLKDMLKLFDQNTASGKALKNTVTTVFNGLFKILTAMLPTVKHVFLEMVIGALKIYIAAKPLVKELEKIFGAGNGDTVAKALMFIIDFMVAGITFTLRFYTAMLRLWEAVAAGAKAVWDFVSNAPKIGTDFVQGLINGITGGTGLLVNAMKNLGQTAIKSIKSTLGIASPSKVMLEMGGHTAAGFAQGVEAGAPKAKGAMQSMATPPAAAGGKGGGARGPIAVTFNVYGVEGAAELKADLPTMMAQAFEKLALMGGT